MKKRPSKLKSKILRHLFIVVTIDQTEPNQLENRKCKKKRNCMQNSNCVSTVEANGSETLKSVRMDERANSNEMIRFLCPKNKPTDLLDFFLSRSRRD